MVGISFIRLSNFPINLSTHILVEGHDLHCLSISVDGLKNLLLSSIKGLKSASHFDFKDIKNFFRMEQVVSLKKGSYKTQFTSSLGKKGP
jgi:hypothetical protein